MLDLRRIRVFREVADRRSFSAAALALSYTQSTVSQAVAELERELGVTLLDRSSRPVRPTPAGELVLRHAEPLLGQAASVQAELAALSSGQAGVVRIGGFSTAWETLIPPAIAAFTADHPGVEVQVEQVEPGPALRRLRSGDLDLAVIYRFPGDPHDPGDRNVAAHLLDDPYALVLPARHRLARDRSVALADLSEERWVAAPLSAPYTRTLVDLCRRDGGFEPDLAYVLDEVAMAQPMVAAGLAVGLLPRLTLQRPHPDVVVKEPAASATARSVWVVRPADRSVPAAKALADDLAAAASAAQL